MSCSRERSRFPTFTTAAVAPCSSIGPRDFIAELDLLTGQRLYATFAVTEAGSIIRVPRSAVKAIIETDAALGELLVQTLFRRREALLLLRSGMQLIGSRYSPDTQRLREFAARNRFPFRG